MQLRMPQDKYWSILVVNCPIVNKIVFTQPYFTKPLWRIGLVLTLLKRISLIFSPLCAPQNTTQSA